LSRSALFLSRQLWWAFSSMLISSAVRKVLGTAYYHPLLVLIPAADWDEQIDRGRSFLAPAATAQASASKEARPSVHDFAECSHYHTASAGL
jgi:hypothetical protein